MSASMSLPRTAVEPSALRRLLTPLINPAVFDFWASKINPAWSWERALARVVARKQEAADTVTLVLAPNANCGGFQAGQHINVTAEINGRRTTRSYSLSDAPRADGRLSITVKLTEGGVMSTHLCQHIQVGDVLELGEAFGDMTLPAQPQGSWLLLAAGSGITPMMSLIRAQRDAGFTAPITLIYWAKTRAELCFVDELRGLAQQFERFQFQPVLTHETTLQAGEAQGFISLAQLQHIVPDLRARDVYACGPAGFVEAARDLSAGQMRSFKSEGFTPPTLAKVEAAATATVRVHLARSGKDLEVPTTLSLLDALEAQGFKPRSGCRMGVCHTCSCTRTAGTTLDMQSGQQSGEPGIDVRLCMCTARTDLTLDL